MVYYGLTYSSGDLGLNVHLSFFLSGAVEIVGNVLAIFTIDFFGRRPSIATFLIIGGCSCLINIALRTYSHSLTFSQQRSNVAFRKGGLLQKSRYI